MYCTLMQSTNLRRTLSAAGLVGTPHFALKMVDFEHSQLVLKQYRTNKANAIVQEIAQAFGVEIMRIPPLH